MSFHLQPSDEIRAARIASRSTRVAAWIAACAAVLSIGVSGLGTYYSTRQNNETSTQIARDAATAAADHVNQTLQGETERSKAEYLRGKRQDLCVKVLNDEQDVASLLLDAHSTIAHRDGEVAGYVDGSWTDGWKPVREALERLSRDVNRLEVIGTQDPSGTAVVAARLRDEFYDKTDNLMNLAGNLENEQIGELNDGVLDDNYHRLEKNDAKIQQLEEQFREAACRDMGAC